MSRLIDLLPKLQALVSDKRLSERAVLRAVLDSLVDAGFRSARYYEINPNHQGERDDTLFLRMAKYADGYEPPAGLEIPYHASTIAATRPQDGIAFGDAIDSPSRAEPWISELKLQASRWADILLNDQESEAIAMLALAVDIEAPDFHDQDRLFFSLVKLLLERYLTAQRLQQISEHRSIARTFIRNNREHRTDLKELASLCAKLALSASGAQACAVFSYEWADRRLVKIAEEVVGRDMIPGDEAYYVGEYLTGSSWENRRYAYVGNIRTFSDTDRVHAQTLKRYQDALGSVNSVLFGRVGTRFIRFHIRLINREGDPRLPFNKMQRDAFNSVSQELGDLVDECSNQMVVGQLGQLASIGLRGFSNSSSVVDAALAAYAELGLDRSILLYRAKGATAYEVLAAEVSEGDPSGHGVPRNLFESAALEKMTTKPGVGIVEHGADLVADDPLLSFVEARGAAGAITVSTLHDGAKLVVLRLIKDARSKIRSRTQLLRFSTESEILVAIAQIVSATVEASRSHFSAEFAEELVAHFGHEVGTPFARLQSRSISGLNSAIKILSRDEKLSDDVKLLEGKKEEINRASHYINQQMKAAVALANRSYGSLDLNFSPFSWRGIVDAAWGEAVAWKESDDGQSSARTITMLPNAAIAAMRSVGDSNLIHNVLVNLLKNAIKYSLPRKKGEPMVVRIIGQSQGSWDVVQVINWGVGIPPDKWELVFDKFYRVVRTDRVRVIRGMGLGLYIARLFVDAHGGRISCRSEATLDDPERSRDLEGYETTFEFRIPRNLPRGQHRVKLT